MNEILEALPGERIVQSNSVATVTTNCLIVENADGKSRTIIPIGDVAEMKRHNTTYPGLLVIAAGLFLLCAACFCSKQGGNDAAIPMGVLGLLFVLGYIGYRKASLIFVGHSGYTFTPEGNPAEASKILKAVSAQIKKSACEE